jgi:hypothetical protein
MLKQYKLQNLKNKINNKIAPILKVGQKAIFYLEKDTPSGSPSSPISTLHVQNKREKQLVEDEY